MYVIKPLEWDEEISGDTDVIHAAQTEFGAYYISQVKRGGATIFYWCFTLEQPMPEFTAEAAKTAAESHWQERVKQCLVEVEPQIKELK